ncbi:MAG TPA: hypothetical protein OGM06_12350 [Clostridiales bacterium]|nr:hypothetical protein [Clostridiales bacterium]
MTTDKGNPDAASGNRSGAFQLEMRNWKKYYFQIHLRHLLAPFPFWHPVVPFSVALLRCIPLPLARAKNSRRILAHSHLEIV